MKKKIKEFGGYETEIDEEEQRVLNALRELKRQDVCIHIYGNVITGFTYTFTGIDPLDSIFETIEENEALAVMILKYRKQDNNLPQRVINL